VDDRQGDRLRKKERKKRDKMLKKGDADARSKKFFHSKKSEHSRNRTGRFASDYVGSVVMREREIQSKHTSIVTEIEAAVEG